MFVRGIVNVLLRTGHAERVGPAESSRVRAERDLKLHSSLELEPGSSLSRSSLSRLVQVTKCLTWKADTIRYLQEPLQHEKGRVPP